MRHESSGKPRFQPGVFLRRDCVCNENDGAYGLLLWCLECLWKILLFCFENVNGGRMAILKDNSWGFTKEPQLL